MSKRNGSTRRNRRRMNRAMAMASNGHTFQADELTVLASIARKERQTDAINLFEGYLRDLVMAYLGDKHDPKRARDGHKCSPALQTNQPKVPLLDPTQLKQCRAVAIGSLRHCWPNADGTPVRAKDCKPSKPSKPRKKAKGRRIKVTAVKHRQNSKPVPVAAEHCNEHLLALAEFKSKVIYMTA